VSFVCGVAMAAVKVVDMVAVGDGLVATVVAVPVVVFRVLDMRDVALVPVVIVGVVRVAVVDVVGVVVMVNADVAAAGAVLVSVVGVVAFRTWDSAQIDATERRLGSCHDVYRSKPLRSSDGRTAASRSTARYLGGIVGWPMAATTLCE
jgi:hypothetical protein